MCGDATLQLAATTGSPSFVTADRPILGVSVKNTGSVACTRDLSGPLQVFTVYTAAGARVWSTADCFPGEGTDVRTLPAQAAVQYNIKWSGTTSAPGCAGTRVAVPAGQYQVRVSIGSLRSAPANFVIG